MVHEGTAPAYRDVQVQVQLQLLHWELTSTVSALPDESYPGLRGYHLNMVNNWVLNSHLGGWSVTKEGAWDPYGPRILVAMDTLDSAAAELETVKV